MDRWNEHTMEMELESMDRQGEAMEIRLSSLELAGAMLGEREIEQLQAENARLREALDLALEQLNYVVQGWPEFQGSRVSWVAGKVGTALSTPTSDWLAQHDAEVRAQAIQSLEDRYRETCRRLYIRAKREGSREEQERCAGLADFEAERAEQKAQECRPQGRTIDIWLGKAQSLWYLARTIREQEESNE